MHRIVLAFLLVLTLSISFNQHAQAADPIVVGEFGSMTGGQATFGVSTDDGVKLAVKERNAAGGVLGRQIQLVTLDDQGKQGEAVTAVTKLIAEDHAVAIIGEVASSLSLAGGKVAQRAGVPMISPSSTNEKVTQIGDMISRVCFIDSFQGYVGASFAKDKLGFTRAAILYDHSQAYSSGLRTDFKKAFTKMGGTIVTEQAYSSGDNDYSAHRSGEHRPPGPATWYYRAHDRWRRLGQR
jgi:branched-chain amino acid transport system substrate-binding protein